MSFHLLTDTDNISTDNISTASLYIDKTCYRCKLNCSKKCQHCDIEVDCLITHDDKCDVCETFVCGRGFTWKSKKYNKLMHMCMDCVFESSLYFKGLMDFTKNQKDN